jgi:arsenite methyltransferase
VAGFADDREDRRESSKRAPPVAHSILSTTPSFNRRSRIDANLSHDTRHWRAEHDNSRMPNREPGRAEKTHEHAPPRNGRYGIDAPYVPALMAAGLLACLGVIAFTPLKGWWLSAIILAILLALYLHTTLRGKFVVWRELLDAQTWRGSEQVLDLGCGRGAVLLMAAAHVPHGNAIGVDIWSSKDQSGNAMDVTTRNAEAEGVADRVTLKTADMRELPFSDGSFDLVVSNVAIHNISDRAGRERAIEEAWRVLRPGGRLLIADISNSRQYQQQLAALGVDARRRALGWRMWWGGPWMPTMLVTAQKPAAARAPA